MKREMRETEYTHKFDGHLLIIEQIGTLKDNTERSFTNFFPNAIVDTDHIWRGGGHDDRDWLWPAATTDH